MIKTPVRGMRDILPRDMMIRDYLFGVIEKIAKSAGFQKIETPAIEHLENLSSKVGGENEALIFKILKRGESLKTALESGGEVADSALRYDLTVPLARYYAANVGELPAPLKALQIGSVWRADAPQKGRFRQFVQCDMDILGDGSILAEIDVISTALKILTKICEEAKISGLTLRINDRRILSATMKYVGFEEADFAKILIILDKNDKIGFEGVRRELMNEGFAEDKVRKFVGLFEGGERSDVDGESESRGGENGGSDAENGGSDAEGILRGVSEFCSALNTFGADEQVVGDLKNIIEVIAAEELGVKVIFDPTLVRGMGYYTGPIFECTADGLNSSIAGGGRYDKMIGRFSGGADVCACGFSIGFERLVTILDDAGFMPKTSGEATAVLVDKKVPAERYVEIVKKAEEMRRGGATVSVLPMARNLGRQIELLEGSGYTKFEKIYRD